MHVPELQLDVGESVAFGCRGHSRIGGEESFLPGGDRVGFALLRGLCVAHRNVAPIDVCGIHFIYDVVDN